MLTPDDQVRYRRHLLLPEVGGQGQKALKRAKVLVIGAGGLGCPMLSYLTAAGVGTIGICDGDQVELSNLQRQVLYTMDDLDQPKAQCAAARLAQINPSTSFNIYPTPMTPDNVAALIAPYDLVVEGVDRYAPRYVLNQACLDARKPFLSAAIGRYDGQVALFEPGQPHRPCYACLVPAAPDHEAACETEGVLGATPGVVGALAAGEAIKWICGMDQTLAGEMLIYQGLAATLRRVTLPRDDKCTVCG